MEGALMSARVIQSACTKKGYMSVPLYNQEWIKKANGWVEYFTPSNLPTCIQ
jgi:hypothetical protein